MILMNISPNRGYAPDQIDRPMTLGDLAVAVEQAIADHGENALVVTYARDNRYGANYGELSSFGELFSTPDEEDEDL